MILFILSFFVFSSGAHAYYVDHLKLQHAGEIGLISFGLGKKVSTDYSFDILYGYVPASIAGREIETYSFKNNFSLIQNKIFKRRSSLYYGINFYHVTGLRYRTSRLNAYPRNYYRMSSIRVLPYLGANIVYSKKMMSLIYLEVGVNDIWIINYYNNPDEINLADYASWATGWTYQF